MTLMAILALVSCGGEPTGPSAAQGMWRFDASYGDCTIVGARLYLVLATPVPVGTLSGGQVHCNGIPGEFDVPPPSLSDGVNHVVVDGDSIAFALTSGSFTASGRISGETMSGQIQIPTPSCQCSDPYIRGTWT